MDAFFSGPYYCYYELPTPDQVSAAFDLIWDTITEEGPFDGLIGFSQGSALASSFLLSDVRSKSPQDPFKCAIFFCASMPFDLASRPFTVSSDGASHDAENGKLLINFDVTDCIPEASNSAGFFGTFDETTLFLHRYTSSYANREKSMITIPTTHIVGTADSYYKQGLALRDLCTPNNREFMEHRLGHDIPKDRNTTTRMSACIQNMLQTVLVG